MRSIEGKLIGRESGAVTLYVGPVISTIEHFFEKTIYSAIFVLLLTYGPGIVDVSTRDFSLFPVR